MVMMMVVMSRGNKTHDGPSVMMVMMMVVMAELDRHLG